MSPTSFLFALFLVVEQITERSMVWCTGPFDPDDLFYDQSVNESVRTSDESDSDEGHTKNPWHRPTHYVYDAAAERTEQRIREGRLAAAALVAGVH